MDTYSYNQILFLLLHIGLSISMFFTLGLYALICLFIKKRQLEAIKLLKWGFIIGILGAISHFYYHYAINNEFFSTIEDSLLGGFLIGGGYGMTIYSLVVGAKELMPNKSVKQTD